MNTFQRRIATERVTAKIDGINTVVAEPGEVVPIAYDHLVPDDKAKPLKDAGPVRSTAGRRAAAASETDKPKRRRGGAAPDQTALDDTAGDGEES